MEPEAYTGRCNVDRGKMVFHEECHLREMLENLRLLAVMVDGDGRVRYCNAHFLEFAGMSREEAEGADWFDLFIPEEGRAERRRVFSEVVEKGYIPPRCDGEVLTRAGKRLVSWSHTLVTGASAPGVLSIGEDVTDRKRMEEALGNIASGVSASTGDEFFRSLVRHLAQSLDAAYAVAGEVDEAGGRISTVAVYAKGSITGNFAYPIKGTPCEVALVRPCVYPARLKSQFPDDELVEEMEAESYVGAPLKDSSGRPMGLLFVADTKPVANEELARSLLTIFGVRASAELERRRAESELKKLSKALEQSPSMVVITDSRGFVEYVNPRFCKVSGYRPEEVAGRRIGELGETSRTEYGRILKTIRSGGEWRGEFLNRKKDGEPYWVSASISPIKDDAGSITHYISVHEDITEHKRADLELITRNQELAALKETAEIIARAPTLESMLDQVLEKTLSLSFLNVRQKGIIFIRDEKDPDWLVMAAQKGISEELALAEARIRVGHCLCGKCARTGQLVYSPDAHSDEAHTARYPGMTRHGHTVLPIISLGRVLGVMNFYLEPGTQPSCSVERLLSAVASQLAVAIDNHRLFNRIIKSKMEWEKTFDAMSELLVVASPDGTIIKANRAAAEATGLGIARMAGGNWPRLFVHGPKSKAAADILANGPDTDGRVHSLEGPLAGADGRERAVEWHISFTRGDDGQTAVICCGEDVTERKRLEERLLHSQKIEAIGQLAGGVAHDFNNITATVIACASVLQLKMDDGDPLRPYVEQILSSAERATQLTQGLLAFGRKQLINPRPVDINEIVPRAARLLSRLIGEDIELRTQHSPDALTVMADPIQMEQVLMNLATNARDAMPNGGVITIRTEKAELTEEFVKDNGYGSPGGNALVSFTDAGCGMDEQTRASIFEPFFTTKEVGKGTGLGLSIVYGIIRQHGGSVAVFSEPGKGTSFKIYLPLTRAAKEEVRSSGRKSSLRGGSETLLLAEDDEAFRGIAKQVLEGAGYRVVTARDGAEALKAYKDLGGAVSLLILDVVMPVMNGREALEEIRAITPGARALFMSGYTRDIIDSKGLPGDVHFLPKPASPPVLLRKIREILDAQDQGLGDGD